MDHEIAVEPASPEAARAEIERTRARMSGTIGELEQALLRKRARVQESLDLRARIGERPMLALGIVLGTGLVLGALSAGSDREAAPRRGARGRSFWEGRVDELLELVQLQQNEIEELECALEEYAGRGGERSGEGWIPRSWVAFGERVVDRVGGALSGAGQILIEEVRHRL